MSEENKGDEKGLFDSKFYFKLGEAINEVSTACDTKDKAVAGAKLAGKTIFNVGLFAGKLGGEILKKLPDAIAKQTEKRK